MSVATTAERAALLMEHLVTHDGYPGHGYSQYSRDGDGTIEVVRVDGDDVTIAGGDRDCSSAVISCYRALGVDVGGATYTGNMRRCMVSTGNFAWKPQGTWSARVGDIYLNEAHHAAMCISPYGSARGDLLAQFSISERGTIDGAEGDQTGYESNIKPYYDYPWDGKIHYVGPDEPAPPGGSEPWQTAFGDPNWLGPLMVTELQSQLGTVADGVISGQTTSNKTFFWAVSGGVGYGDGGSDAVLELQGRLLARGYDPNGLDRHYGRGCIGAHQRALADAGYYPGAIDGYHGTQTNAAVCRALADGWYRTL